MSGDSIESCVFIYAGGYYSHHSYNPPSPAVMDTAGGNQWFDSDL